jgi:DNA-binding SARP family transcriptional activator
MIFSPFHKKEVMQVEQVRQKDVDIPSSCRLRVFIHGPLEVWRREASDAWKLVDKDAWGKGRPARSVFKRLLVAPGRRLSRGSIQDDLWPDTENFELADKNVYNAINQIRRVTGKALVKTFETIYEVADQSVIWVDRDACQAWLKEAENWGYTSREALPLLEQALAYLERGELLEGEDGTWVYGLRKKSEDMLKQCRYWLAQAYEVQGKLWQAGEQYRALCATTPPNEEALQHWMALLNLQSKSQEALKCYQDITAAWEAQGYPPSEALQKMVAPGQGREEPHMNLSRRSFLLGAQGIGAELLVSQYARGTDTQTPSGQPSNRELLKEMIDRNFPQEVTYNLLSSNIKTLNFREEWQYVVNNLVAETKTGLRAMVFDVELTRWWNSIAGQVYMMTNLKLLKERVPIKRIFLLSSLDVRLRMNALMNAYVHHKMGISVKVCTATGFQDSIPFTPDMFSVHDNLFVALYYFSPAKPLTNLLLEDKHISEFCSFYDELFLDDRLCTDIESLLARTGCEESFWASAKMQLKLLQRLEKVESILELAKNTWM